MAIERRMANRKQHHYLSGHVSCYFEGTRNFQSRNPKEIFTKQGELKSEYRKANDIIARCERDELFTNYMRGEKQVIMTAEMFGADWKIKIDSYHPNICIVDLKVMESLNKHFWTKDYGYRTSSARGEGILHTSHLQS